MTFSSLPVFNIVQVSWLKSIRDWQEEFVGNMSSREFVDTVTGDLLSSRVFVFTPKGEVITYCYESQKEFSCF